MPSGYWQDLTAPDFAGLDPATTVAVLPVAAVEQHGPHLPLGTDALINAGIVEATLRRLDAAANVLVLPPLALGTSAEHADVAGTLSIAAERLLPVWVDAGRSVARAGLRKLVILNTHGGQRALVDLAAMQLRAEDELLVVRCNYFAFGAPAGLFDAAEWSQGLHGGEVETSLMLHLHGDLVRRDRLENFTGLVGRLAESNRWLGAEKPIGFGWKARDLHPAGVVGNAARADAARGAAYLDHIADSFVTLLGEVAAMPLEVLAAPVRRPES